MMGDPAKMLETCAKDPDFVYADHLLVVAAERRADGDVNLYIQNNRTPKDVDLLRLALHHMAKAHGIWRPGRLEVFGWGALTGMFVVGLARALGLL